LIVTSLHVSLSLPEHVAVHADPAPHVNVAL